MAFSSRKLCCPSRNCPEPSALLGPEMRSTGEVMGHAAHFGHAFAKSQIAAGMALPLEGAVLISVNDYDKSAALKFARDLHRMGFTLYATPGTAAFFRKVGLPRRVGQQDGGWLSPHGGLDPQRQGAA